MSGLLTGFMQAGAWGSATGCSFSPPAQALNIGRAKSARRLGTVLQFSLIGGNLRFGFGQHSFQRQAFGLLHGIGKALGCQIAL
jgi:hypothetical protein